MGKHKTVARLGWLALCAACATVAGAGELPSSWENLQPCEINKAGLVKISVPLETLTAARAGLEDLRLYDSARRETAYCKEQPVEPNRTLTLIQKPPKKFHVTLNQETTVVDITTGLTQALEAIILETPAHDFIKAVKVESSDDQVNWKALGTGELIFRLGDGASLLRLPIPASVCPFLRLTADDRRTAVVPFTGAQLQLYADPGPPTPAEPLGVEITGRNEEPGQTRLELRLAGANCTLAGLSLVTSDPLFTRHVTLTERHYAGNEFREAVVCREQLYRVALEGLPAVSHLTFAVDVPVHSPDLVLTIDNGDNQPLTIAEVTGKRRPVYLTFLAAQQGTCSFLTGNRDCAAPRYDLAVLAPQLKNATLLAPAAGALGRNPTFQGPQEASGIESLAAALDVSLWRYSQAVRLGQHSVQELDLDLEVLAHAASGLQDLRLACGGKQVPYIVERTSQTRSFAPAMTVDNDPKRPNVSRWKITLPQHPLPISRLTFTVSAAYFKREVTLSEQIPDERGNLHGRGLASATWVRRPEQKDNHVTLQLGSAPATDNLVLEVENGDNPALELKEPAAWYPLTRLLFVAPPEGNVTLHYGKDDARAPQYDLELVVPRMLVAPKGKASLAQAVAVKPGGSFLLTFHDAGWLFWVVLVGVVVALLFVIAKLLPKPKEEAR